MSLLASGVGSIHKLCVKLLRNFEPAFHVKQSGRPELYPRVYPQGPQAFYVAFHVKRRRLWITSVDNFGRGVEGTDGDGRRGWAGHPNG